MVLQLSLHQLGTYIIPANIGTTTRAKDVRDGMRTSHKVTLFLSTLSNVDSIPRSPLRMCAEESTRHPVIRHDHNVLESPTPLSA